MKTILCLLTSVTIFTNVMSGTKSLLIYKTQKAPVIDGIISSDEVWSDSWNVLDQCKIALTKDLTAKYQMCYDEKNLYILVNVTDPTFVNNLPQYFYNDIVMTYVSMDTLSSPTGAYKKGDWLFAKVRGLDTIRGLNHETYDITDWVINHPNLKVAETNNVTSYTQEWQIPWADVTEGMSPRWYGENFKFDIAAFDNTGTESAVTQVQFWNSNSDRQWENTNYHGYIFLDSVVGPGDPRNPQTITFSDFAVKKVGDADFQINAFASSGLPLSFKTSDYYVANTIGNKIHINGAGSCFITAMQNGDTAFKRAVPVSKKLVVIANNSKVDLIIEKVDSITPLIDGRINSNDPWAENSYVIMNLPKGTTRNMTAGFNMCYNDSNLYIATVVTDSTPYNLCDITAFENDEIELYISMDTMRTNTYKVGDFNFRKIRNKEFNQNTSSDFINSPNFKIAETDSNYTYVQEWQIPWSSLSAGINWNKRCFRFDVMARDNSGTECGNVSQQQFWHSNADDQWISTYNMGIVGLSKGFGSTQYYYFVEQICLVSVDENSGKNIITWNKTDDQGIKEYNIYKETSIKDEFVKIGTVPFSEPGQFVDLNSNPAKHADRYKMETISITDESTGFSPVHQTIHLAICAGLPGYYNLIWSAYEGMDFSTYYIYKGTSPYDLTLHDSISSNQLQYTDKTSGKVYYRIAVKRNSPCPAFNLMKSASTDGNDGCFILSNIEYFDGNKIKNQTFKNLTLSPNPFEDKIKIQCEIVNPSAIQVQIFNILGSEIYNYESSNKISGNFIHVIDAKTVTGISKINIIKVTIGYHSRTYKAVKY